MYLGGGDWRYRRVCNILLIEEACMMEGSRLRAVRWAVDIWGHRGQKPVSEGFGVAGTNV